MDRTSDWLTYVSLGLATLAFAVSLATYIRAGSRVSAQYRLNNWSAEERGPHVILSLTNKGHAAIQILSFTGQSEFLPGILPKKSKALGPINMDTGPNLPFALQPLSTQRWLVKLDPSRPIGVSIGYGKFGVQLGGEILVSLGDGHTIKARPSMKII